MRHSLEVLVAPQRSWPLVIALIAAVAGSVLLSSCRPGASRASAALLVDVMRHGAHGDGLADDTGAVQSAIDLVPPGGTVLIPAGRYKLTRSISSRGKSFTLRLEGTLLDRIPSWKNITNDVSLHGKGVFAFESGSISVIGAGQLCFSGPLGVSAVSQTQRIAFYFYRCRGVLLQGLVTEKCTGSAVATYACADIRHLDSIHRDGYAPVIHRSPAGCTISNVEVHDGIANGIAVSNRGFLEPSIVPWTRGRRVQVTNCGAYGTTQRNGYAVGITIDACDDFVCTGCIVDNASIGTMGYSFAQSSQGAVTGNLAANVDNPASGNYRYAGIGFECVDVTDIDFSGNSFDEVICAYQIARATNCRFSGVRKSRSTANSDAVVNSFASVGSGPGEPECDNIQISGLNNGGAVGIMLSGRTRRLSISDFHTVNLGGRWLSSNDASMSRVASLTINNCSTSVDGQSSSIIALAPGVAREITVNGFRSDCAGMHSGEAFFYGGAEGCRYYFSNVFVQNPDTVFSFATTQMSQLHVRDLHVSGVRRSVLSGEEHFRHVWIEDWTCDGVPMPRATRARESPPPPARQ